MAIDRAAVVSHEIRGPVGVMMTLTDMLLRRGLAEGDRHLVEMIRLAGHHVLGVAEDLIAEASLDADRLRVVDAPLSPEALVRRVADLWRPLADTGERRLVLEIDSLTPATILSDEARIRQILFNLVSNATKATRAGTIVIAVAPAADTGDSPAAVAFEVRDDGPGLPAAFRSEAFAADTSGSQTAGQGAGLGLWISSRIALSLAGLLSFTAGESGGTIARLTVPVAPPLAAPADEAVPSARPNRRSGGDRRKTRRREADSTPQATAVDTPLSGRRVLVVDDSSVSRMLLNAVLTSFGMVVSTVGSGAEAEAELATAMVDLVMLDWSLGGETGSMVLDRLLASHGDALAPVIAVTAAARPPLPGGKLRAAVRKPFTPRELYEAITHALFDTACRETAS